MRLRGQAGRGLERVPGNGLKVAGACSSDSRYNRGMDVEISESTLDRLADHARQRGMSADEYVSSLMAEADDQREFTAAVERGLKDLNEGRVLPARDALLSLGQKFGFSR